MKKFEIKTKPAELNRLKLNLVSHLPLVKELDSLIRDYVGSTDAESIEKAAKQKEANEAFQQFFSELNDKRFLCVIAAITLYRTVNNFVCYTEGIKDRTTSLLNSYNDFRSELTRELERYNKYEYKLEKKGKNFAVKHDSGNIELLKPQSKGRLEQKHLLEKLAKRGEVFFFDAYRSYDLVEIVNSDTVVEQRILTKDPYGSELEYQSFHSPHKMLPDGTIINGETRVGNLVLVHY
ncbi:hypothetical protein MZM54_03940 [[Brevibacterium] frigoritolerans]|nr:hypothetical protein [Peribacillus frigoritolerans]